MPLVKPEAEREAWVRREFAIIKERWRKDLGMLGLEERGLGGGYMIGSLKIQGLLCETESRFVPDGPAGQN